MPSYFSRYDFAVKYDRFKDTSEDITKLIIYSIIVKLLKAKKPVVHFIGGDSGEGKSYAALRLMEIMCEIQGFDFLKLLEHINVFTPIQYPKKLDNLLFTSKNFHKDSDDYRLLRRANMLITHEARTLVPAKDWRNFINMAIADVNALSRSIKRVYFIIISQFIRDITSDMRYTIRYYSEASRPIGQKTKLSWAMLYKDTHDLEKPRLKKRRLRGYLVNPQGRYKKIYIDHFEMNKPCKEACDLFERLDYEAKGKIIHNKIEKLIKEMSINLGVQGNKIKAMVEWYCQNPEQINLVGKQRYKKWRFNKQLMQMHDLTKTEFDDFEKEMNSKLKEMGILGEDTENQTDIAI